MHGPVSSVSENPMNYRLQAVIVFYGRLLTSLKFPLHPAIRRINVYVLSELDFEHGPIDFKFILDQACKVEYIGYGSKTKTSNDILYH